MVKYRNFNKKIEKIRWGNSDSPDYLPNLPKKCNRKQNIIQPHFLIGIKFYYLR